MSTRIEIKYEGQLQCCAVHTPSGDKLLTDAPPDNAGRGLHFSPTDLVAAASGACMLTVMGIAAQRHGLSIDGARASVDKAMSTSGRRFIEGLAIHLVLPATLKPEDRELLERTARSCPVTASLSADTEIDVRFTYE